MATRTSTRQAAQKAKEAIAAAPDVKSRGTAGAKRKGSADKGAESKRSKKEADKEPDEAKQPTTGIDAQPPKGRVSPHNHRVCCLTLCRSF